MKKITFLFSLLFIAFQGNSQTLTQNFDTALTWIVAHPTGTSGDPGWTRVTAGTNPGCTPAGGAGMAKLATYDFAAGNAYTLTAPVMTLVASTNYRIKFKMYRDSGYPTDADNIKVLFKSSPFATTGTVLGTIHRSTQLSPTVSADGWYSYYFDVPAGTSGAKYFYFLGTGFFGNNIYVDEVAIGPILANDAELVSTTLASSIVAGSTSISGTFVNSGTSPISTISLNWQVDSGAINTQPLTGLSVAPGTSYNFVHSTPWNATLGNYTVKVWISGTNGNDEDLTNNEIIRSVSVATNSTTRMPLYEKFSSATCPPCATFNTTYFTPFYTTNHNNFAMISYQVSWPAPGDPYYTAEVGTRRTYYGVTAAPTLYVDSNEGTAFDVAALQSNLTSALAKPAYFLLSASHALVGTALTVNVNTTPYLTGSYKLYVAVVEKITTGNVASNGETQFKNVFMKMLPDANGTTISFVADTPVFTQLQANLTGLNIEEMNDLSIVVFVQNVATKAIMQATYAVNGLATAEFNKTAKIKIYPNPSEGMVRIATESPLDVVLTDISGKVVFTMNQVTGGSDLNLSKLQSGVYFAKMTGEGIEQTEKIILK
jgi:hypothetical protein